MGNGTIQLTPIEAATLVRLAAREHERRRKKGAPAQGYSAASWAMELGGEKQLIDRLSAEVMAGLAPPQSAQ